MSLRTRHFNKTDQNVLGTYIIAKRARMLPSEDISRVKSSGTRKALLAHKRQHNQSYSLRNVSYPGDTRSLKLTTLLNFFGVITIKTYAKQVIQI